MNPADWDWGTILSVSLGDGTLTVVLGPLAWIGGAIALVALALWQKPWLGWRQDFGVVDFDLNFPGGRCKIARNQGTAQLSHEAFVELATRKAAVPFDEEHDSIDEIYNSWYELFGQLRRITRSLPAKEIRHNQDLHKLLNLLLDAMNLGLRPHLTRWQAPFRAWLAEAKRQNPAASTPVLQRGFDEYTALVQSLKETNAILFELSSCLATMAHGEPSP